MSGSLDLKLLGPPKVFLDGQPVKFATHKVLALLAYLVVEGGKPPRERLQDIFWPDSEARLAQAALRNTLARLKKALPGVDKPLQIDGERLGFNFSTAYTLDMELAARALVDQQAPGTETPDIAMLESAAGANRGPFMDGFSLPDAPAFEEWLTLQRAIWLRHMSMVYENLSRQQLENRLIPAAIETVLRWITMDRLNEAAYRRLMRLHFLNDNRSEALLVYENCRRLLAQNLDVKPSAQTEKALAFIRCSPIATPFDNPPIEGRKPLRIPFVGRLEEYKTLVRSFRSAQKGQTQVVFLSGESGIGKSRLAAEFLKWAGMEGAELLQGRAIETHGKMPYQPIIDSLRERVERENSPDDLLDDVWLVELSRILPELRERYPDLAAASNDPATRRARLFEAVARLLEALSTRQTLVWQLDDLQLADQDTLSLLHYLTHRWKTSQPAVLLLLLLSEKTSHQTPMLQQWMKDITQEIKATRLALEKMCAVDLQRLMCALTGENAPGLLELTAWLLAETAGQPFILTETLTTLDENNLLVWSQETPPNRLDALATLAKIKPLVDDQTLAPAIRDVILGRLKRLSQPALDVLAAASVIDRSCSFEQLRKVSGVDEQDSLNALDELLSAGVLVENRNDEYPYAITHERIRAIVFAQLSAARQNTYQLRALEALARAETNSTTLAQVE